MRSYLKKISQHASKLSKEQLLNVLDDIVGENENLTSILESISTGLVIVGTDFVLVQNNKTAESALPLKIHFDDPKSTLVPFWELIDDDDISAFFKNVFDKKITNSCEDFTTMTGGGVIRFLTISISPLLYKGQDKGRIILIQDITESKNQEVLLHRMENLANLTNLAAGMAHEIKNPLGAISIHIQLIQKALAKARENNNILGDKKFAEDHIDVINEEIEHLNKLVMDFLLAVRPVKASLELKNPFALIENIADFFKPEFTDENIDVEISGDSKNVKIMLDEKLFRDVIINLAQNSLAAIKSKKENLVDKTFKGKFFINCNVAENKYFITVSDNGCGMDSDTVSKIFEPYYTTKANGTGLGMTMVYKIIKEFSGEIFVESEEGKGTMFRIQFPIPQKNKKLLTQAGE